MDVIWNPCGMAAEVWKAQHLATLVFDGGVDNWVWINTIFRGMNIHLPAILGFTRYQGFDPSPTWQLDPTSKISQEMWTATFVNQWTWKTRLTSISWLAWKSYISSLSGLSCFLISGKPLSLILPQSSCGTQGPVIHSMPWRAASNHGWIAVEAMQPCWSGKNCMLQSCTAPNWWDRDKWQWLVASSGMTRICQVDRGSIYM